MESITYHVNQKMWYSFLLQMYIQMGPLLILVDLACLVNLNSRTHLLVFFEHFIFLEQ